MLQHVLDVLDGQCDVTLVLGADAASIGAALRLPKRVVVNDRWAEGLASSIKAGLDAIGDVPDDGDRAVRVETQPPCDPTHEPLGAGLALQQADDDTGEECGEQRDGLVERHTPPSPDPSAPQLIHHCLYLQWCINWGWMGLVGVGAGPTSHQKGIPWIQTFRREVIRRPPLGEIVGSMGLPSLPLTPSVPSPSRPLGIRRASKSPPRVMVR